MPSGKYYFEWTKISGGEPGFGVHVNSEGGSGGDYIYHGNGYIYPGAHGPYSALGAGDVVGIAVDATAGSVAIYLNNSLKYTFTGLTTGNIFPYLTSTGGGTSVITVNFGQRPFKYTAPTDYKCLCTQNLPDLFGANNNSAGDKNNPSKYFEVKTYTGTGADLDIKGLNFKPDLVWMKPRSVANDHVLVDAARGVTERIFANIDNAESAAAESLKTFNSDGFTLGDHSSVNTGNVTHVAWAWDAGSAAATPSTAGNITISNQWVNATAGFSMSKYTMGADGGTFDHALTADGSGVKPDWIVVKRLNSAASWCSWHKGIPNTKYMMLDKNDAASTWNVWGDTDATTTLVTVSGDSYTGNNGDTYIAYCWVAKPGYSAFGSYTGTGGNTSSVDQFIYTGFTPRFLIIKCATAGTTQWMLVDSERDKTNPNTIMSWADASDPEENHVNNELNIFSNGFELSSNTYQNYSNTNGETFIYAAFASHPLKTARAQ